MHCGAAAALPLEVVLIVNDHTGASYCRSYDDTGQMYNMMIILDQIMRFSYHHGLVSDDSRSPYRISIISPCLHIIIALKPEAVLTLAVSDNLRSDLFGDQVIHTRQSLPSLQSEFSPPL